ncbi:ACP S-malonyltransferase [Clostridium tarantellae]|uniref:Malonyl CoA-acyl carrier protein transacylase n=1 Tax=Clostridium tarantellae TaxID=39493 RepID=A0A6I1MN45_9CLOT|nr:ACP S-malonyltransferase [Clostridium tarantellae]MPQ43898.1 ACP S-malonyltransferase [Clostridium tarantellae]
MSNIGFVFAGQGAQYVGMGKEFYDNYEESRNIFNIASEALDLDIANLCFNSDKELLNKTENTQPAIVTTNMAILSVLKKNGIEAEVSCGLSLGEYSALINAGVLEFKEAVKLVQKRGKFMQEAVKEGIGGMIAVLSLKSEAIEEIIEKSSKYGIIEGANYNSPAQTVLSGENKALEKALELIKQAGGKGIKLPVSAPFHCSMLEPAAINLERELEKVNINEMNSVVLSNVKGIAYYKDDSIKDLLKLQVMKSVLFMKNIETMIDMGVDVFIEVGPGKTLSSFIKKINRNVTILNVEDIKSLEKTVNKLKELEVL